MIFLFNFCISVCFCPQKASTTQPPKINKWEEDLLLVKEPFLSQSFQCFFFLMKNLRRKNLFNAFQIKKKKKILFSKSCIMFIKNKKIEKNSCITYFEPKIKNLFFSIRKSTRLFFMMDFLVQ